MKRGRVTLKRIENKINRQVSFSKRRSGLLKKSHEISVLCDADVAVIVFSTKGKLREYASNFSMERILERYERYSHGEIQHTSTNIEPQEILTLDHVKIKARIEILKKRERNMMGEGLDSLSLKEIRSLEKQIDTSLKHIKLRKDQLMVESISQLQNKAKEKEKEITQLELEQHTHSMMPLFHAGTLDNRSGTSHQAVRNEVEKNPREGQPVIVMPPWMIQHMLNM